MASNSSSITQIQTSEKEAVVRILANAFHDYPAMRFFFGPDARDYDRKLKKMVEFFCEARLQMEWPPFLLRVDGRPVAAALVNPPVSSVFNQDLRQELEDLKRAVGPNVMDNLLAYEKTCEGMEPEAPHYYLGMIGVGSGQNGKGYARLLLDHIHQLVDNDPGASGIGLNTENPANLPLYRHFHYEVSSEADVGRLHTWSMFRPSLLDAETR